MKLSAILLAISAVASSAFEGCLDEEHFDSLEAKHEHGRELFLFGSMKDYFEKYRDINKSCCGESLDECKCPVRQSSWWWIKNRWEHKCATTIPLKSSITAFVLTDDNFSTLLGLLKDAELAATLSTGVDGGYTLFAPTNAAFDSLGDVDLTVEQLKEVLLYHVVAGTVTSDQLFDGQVVTTLSGQNITISISGADVAIETVSGGIVNVTATDEEASNGIIHTVDGVLVPDLN